MIVDARSLPAGIVIESEVCIIGAGAAGITLAREFSDSQFRVALLESGGMDYEEETQELYQGRSIGRPFQDLTACRQRFFGGTTNHWGGWCLPYDPIDFEPRDDLPYHGWPFDRSYLDPWYRRAQEVCSLGPYDYRPSRWGISERQIPAPFSGPHFECKILQVSPVQFGPVYAQALNRAPRVTVYLHANAFHIDSGEADTEIQRVSIKTLAGNQFVVRARIYILATGGIENARLLLASGKRGGNGLGNARDLVGRCLMVHLCYSGGIIVPSNPYTNFDFRTGAEYTEIGGKHSFVSVVGLSEASVRQFQLQSIIINWSYRFPSAFKALNHLIIGEGPGGSRLADLSEVIGNLDLVAGSAVHKALFGEGMPVEALDVRCASAQEPNPRSRVMLGSEVDRLGMPEVVVDWQPTAEDQYKAAKTLHLLGTEIGSKGFGRLRSSLTDDGTWPKDFYGDEHHLGTTRMHPDPVLGVVDENCRVHSMANLYVAGSSVFPSGSANNSTLTIVALALRLADHVKAQLS